MREELVNQISKDILGEYETNWAVVQAKVKIYAELLDNTVRNFYELQMMSSDCPLFALCYFLEEGYTCFTDDETEYIGFLDALEKRVNEQFQVEIEDIGYEYKGEK